MLNSSLTWNRVCCIVTILFSVGLACPRTFAHANPPSPQQQTAAVTVTGTVQDSRKEPLVGATVLQKGSSNGVITDLSGEFRISVPPGATLVVSFVGMRSREVQVGGRDRISVTLEDGAVALDDVVVIGYGTQSRATVTGAIAKVDADQLAAAPAGDPMTMLQGKVPGMQIRVNSGQPGASPQVILRGGTTTAPESDAPLYIVDGVIRTMKDINYNDIASIEVLKDAASTAIYGAKAANGIVIITTKKGKSGKGQISFSYGLSVDHQPKRMPMSDAREYLYATRTAALHATDPDKYLNGGFAMSTSNIRNSLGTTCYLDNWIDLYGQGYVEDLLLNQGYQTMEDPANPGKMLMFKDTDFQDNLFQTPVNHDFNIDFSGGSDRGTYYLSLGYLTQDGIVVGSSYNRWSFMSNGSYKLNNNLTVRSSLSYTSRNSSGINENNVMARASKMPPTLRQYYEDGTPAPGELTKSFRTRLHEIYYQENRNTVDRTTLMAELDWEPYENLHIRPMFSFWNNEGRDHSFERYNEVVKDRPASANHNQDKHFQYDLIANYTKTLWGKHNFDFMIGYNHIYEMAFRMSGSGYGGTSDYIETLNGIALESAKTSTTESYKKMSSFFGRVNYNYDTKYMLSLSLRYDGSSHFAANHKFATFPGVSVGWNIHREYFFENLRNVINNLKLRGSWGKTGNDNLSLSNTEGAYKSGYTYAGEAGILNTTLMNRDLLWEETTSADLGVEMGLWNNRLKVQFDVYRKVTDNRLLDEKLWSETGFSSIKSNFGSIITKGLEVAIDANAIETRDFTWNIGASFSYFRTVVGKLPANGADKNRTGGGIIFDEKLGKYIEVGGFAEGERFGARFAYQMDGVYATDEDAANAPYDEQVAAGWLGKGKVGGDAIWHDSDGNGIINQKDMKLVGYLHPDKMGSFNNTFRYKNLSLRIVTDFSAGNVIDNMFRASCNANSRNNYATIHDVTSSEMWHKQGDIATIPRYDVESDWDFGKRNHGRKFETLGFSGGSANTLYIKKGDYLAFREVSLSYMLSTKWLDAVHVDNVNLSAAVYNLGYWTAYDGLTPEVIGADAGKYSRPRQFLFSLRVTLK